MMSSFTTVSYTHLDVYKRQIRGYIEKNFGLYLLPKLITDSYPAVKSLMLNLSLIHI